MWVNVPLAFALVVANIPSINYPIPEEYKKGAVAVVHMVDSQEEIDMACGKAPEGRVKLGCMTDGGELVVSNPCNHKKEMLDKDTFTYLLCHEKAHVNGWRH